MRKHRSLLWLAIVAALNMWALPAQCDVISFNFLEDISLEREPRNIRFSPSGRHFMVEYGDSPDHFLAVYLDTGGATLHVKKLPGPWGAWKEGGALAIHIKSPEDSKYVVLPAYDKVLNVQEENRLDPGSLGTLDRLAIAAWAYSDDSAFVIDPIGEEVVFSTLKQLSAATLAYFMSDMPEHFMSSTLDAMAAAQEVYFLNELDVRARGSRLEKRSRQLFMVEGPSEVEVTSPEIEGVRAFSFDAAKRRVLADVDHGALLFDALSGRRRLFPTFDVEASVEITYHLVPNGDRLLVRLNYLDATHHIGVDERLELWTLDGMSLAQLPTGVAGAEGYVNIGKFAVSRHLLAVPLYAKVKDGQTWRYQNILRIFEAVHSP